MSGLGKRKKATKNDTYLNFALGKIRAQQPPPLNLEETATNVTNLLKNKPAPTKKEPSQAFQFPPGLTGQMAQYFYTSAIRPVPEIALAAALGLMAGVCGRAFNVSGSGLNQYLILLAKTGSGKEGALAGIDNLLAAVRPLVPMVTQFMGPAAFASGQSLIKVLDEKPCFISVLGEFGLTLQEISDRRANSSQIMLRKVLLDLYAKSGWSRQLHSSVYSDKEKNTKLIHAPNVSILGESTPETFFEGLDTGHIAEGLIPRFSLIEYTGPRPPRNPKAFTPPDQDLTQRFSDLVAISLTVQNNKSFVPVDIDEESTRLMDEFDLRADQTINNSENEVIVQLWNRSHLKALKLAALLAVGVNPHQPIITGDLAQWAIDFCLKDIEIMATRFSQGDVGVGDSKQFNDLKRVIKGYYQKSFKEVEKYGVEKLMFDHKFIPYLYMIRKTASLASFRSDKIGATGALKKQLQALVDSGMLNEVSKMTLNDKYSFSGVAYTVGRSWKE
jgi:hypothetical protein